MPRCGAWRVYLRARRDGPPGVPPAGVDLGDVAETPAAGGLVEAELERDLGRRQQRELLWLVGCLVHTPIMNEGCCTARAGP